MVGKMYTDELGRITFSSRDLIKEIYRGNIDKLDSAHVFIDDEDYAKYIQYLTDNGLRDWPIPLPEDRNEIDITSFDSLNQHSWLMPLGYKEYPVASYLLGLCSTAEETARVEMELDLFQKYNMMNLLCFLKYMVDKLRENTILWGVGRGSSVASYCLYLLGVHKINSLKYDLDIREFLK
jgi:DNA polymerase III alpha subunit